MSHGHGPYHGKDKNKSSITRRKKSWDICHRPYGKKDKAVKRSSHGHFNSVAELEAHRLKVSYTTN